MRFCGRFGLVGWNPWDFFGDVVEYRRYRYLPGVILYSALSSRWALTTAVWVPLIFRRRKLAFELDDDMRRASEYAFRRGKGARPIQATQNAES